MFEFVAQIIFGISLTVLVYTYIGYPLVVYLLGLVRPLVIKRAEIYPTVTLLITAFNEERDIAAKLENTLKLDYPKDRKSVV